MYIISRSAGWGRNFYSHINDGSIYIHHNNGHESVKIERGQIVEFTSHTKNSCTRVCYGKGLTHKRGAAYVKEEYFEPGTLRAIKRGSLWKKETGVLLCGRRGTVECYATSGGAYGREIFTYETGVVGYVASRWRKQLLVYRPNGKPWIVINGRVQLSHQPLATRIDPSSEDLDMQYYMRSSDWSLKVFHRNGVKVITSGGFLNRQKQGEWLIKGKATYYLSGVSVSHQLYQEDPEKWDGHEVLKIENAQLRCSLLNRMGYDRLLEKTGAKQIDESEADGQLLEIDTSVQEGRFDSADRIMRLLKVTCPSTSQVYVLRVPPDIDSCQRARQWTFGLRRESINNGVQLELVRET
jgi:hypothetical protein